MLLAMALLPLPACTTSSTGPRSPGTAQTNAASTGLPDRDPRLAHELIANGGVLLDVRTPAEFATRHVEGAVNIPVDELLGRTADVERLAGGDKNKPIVVYCGSGKRAARAKGMLLEAGFKQVTNLGSLDDWYAP
jgi:phage shock protein E